MTLQIAYLADVPEHLPTLAGWHHREWHHLNPGDTVDERVERYQGYLQRRAIPTMFVALLDGTALGSASLVRHDMDTHTQLTPWLASVYVMPASRGRGIGSTLVERVAAEASALGVADLYLFTPDREGLYARLGWKVLERTDYLGEAVVVMVRRLAALAT